MAESSTFGKPVIALAAGGVLLLVIFVIILVNLGGDSGTEIASGEPTESSDQVDSDTGSIGSEDEDLDELVIKIRKDSDEADSDDDEDDDQLNTGTFTIGPNDATGGDSDDDDDRVTTSTTADRTTTTSKSNTATTERATTTAKPTTTVKQFAAGTAEEHFIERLYMGVLDRSPDSAGFDFWVGQLEESDEPENIVKRFVDSASLEEPTPAISVVLERLLGGQAPSAVVSAFEKETEERAIYLAVNNTTVVNRFNHRKL